MNQKQQKKEKESQYVVHNILLPILAQTKIHNCYHVGTISLVDETHCDVSTKPNDNTDACTSAEVPECNSDCSDGVLTLTGDEIFDTNGQIGNCCESDYSCYLRESLECWQVNPLIDATFTTSTYALYLFQGDYFAKYSGSWYDFTPDEGYLKIIESFPITSFTNDISAAAISSDSQISSFQGNSDAIVDLNSGEDTEYQRTFMKHFEIPDELKACMVHTIFLYCNDVGYYANDDYLYDKNWGYETIRSVTWTIHNSIYYFTSSNIEIDSSQSIFIGSNCTSLDEICSLSCYDEICASCNVDNNKSCYNYECRDNYVLYDGVSLNNKTLMYLDLDIESEIIIDQFFGEGRYDTLLDYSESYSGITGRNSTTMIFKGSPRLDEELYVTNFKISFRFKPYSISYGRLISINHDNAQIILQDNGANYDNSDVNVEYIGLFKVGNHVNIMNFYVDEIVEARKKVD